MPQVNTRTKRLFTNEFAISVDTLLFCPRLTDLGMEIENSCPYFFGDIGEHKVKETWPLRRFLLIFAQLEFDMISWLASQRHTLPARC